MTFTKSLIVAALAIVPTASLAQDMTGAYGGIAAGIADIDVNDGALDGDGSSVGVYLGYNVDMGGIVYGGEIDFDKNDYEVPDVGVTVDYATRLKARAGAKVGGGLLYGVGGFVLATSNQLDDGQGYLYGVGYDLPVGGNYHVGAELLQHEFEDDARQVGVTTLKVRLGFNF
jgi:hypothetical protein